MKMNQIRNNNAAVLAELKFPNQNYQHINTDTSEENFMVQETQLKKSLK